MFDVPRGTQVTTWTELRKYIDGTYFSAAFYWSSKSGLYVVVTEEIGGVRQECSIVQDSGADQLDFEASFKDLPPRSPLGFQVSGSVYVTTTGSLPVSLVNGAIVTTIITGTIQSNVTNLVAVGNNAVSGSQLTGSTFHGYPLVAGGFFYTGSTSLVTALKTDVSGALYVTTSGSLLVQGMAPSGSAKDGNPVFIAGIDSSGSVRPPLIDGDGTAVFRSREEATFFAVVTGSQIGNNKSLASLVNAAGSGVLIRIHGIWITNVQVTAVTGIAALFEFRRVTGHSAGSQITSIEESDTADELSSNVTLRTGATVVGESSSLLWRTYWSSDDWGPGTLDVEAHDHAFQNMFPLLQLPLRIKPITLRGGEGLTVKHAANSTAGTFDIFIVFSQVNVP